MPECPSYDPQQVYTCQTHVSGGRGCCSLPGGWGSCCDIGCCPCDDDEGALDRKRVSVNGRRWMRPAIGRTNRDAMGVERNLVSNVPLRVPFSVNYERAACFDMRGGEYFEAGRALHADDTGSHGTGEDVCDCHPSPRSTPRYLGDGCEHGEVVGETMRGLWPDCWAYTGHQYVGASPGWMWCRHVSKHNEALMPLAVGPPFQTLFARSSHPQADKHHPSHACAPNALTWYTQKAPASDCRADWCDEEPCYYNDTPQRQIWNFVRMNWGAGEPADRPHIVGDVFLTDPAKLDLQNAVLAKVLSTTFPSTVGDVNFDQLDHAFTQGGDMSKWHRSYNWTDVTTCEDLVSAAALPNSYFVHTHEPADVDLVILIVDATLHLVPYRIDVSAPLDDLEAETLPYSRMWIRAECRARVRMPNGQCRLIPQADVPPIIFKDDQNRTLAEVPKRVEWWGFLGHSSNPSVTNIEGTSNDGLAEDLSAVVIPGWPAMYGSRPAAADAIYRGRVGISFEEGG